MFSTGIPRITNTSSSSLLEIRELAFDDTGPFDLALQPGECAGLSGPSGSGKTRLLRSIADLDVHRGRMWLAGVDSADIPPPSWRRQVALLPAESAWWHDEVGTHFVEAPTPARLASLGFTESVMGWRVDRLSSGEKQRLAVLRMLAMAPRVLLLDEPTANLDEDNIGRLEILIRDYLRAGNAASIWVSHDRRQLQRVAGRCYRLDEGHLVETGA
ncbi:MAG: ATP-binding cassette domain-containing protein [Gammaproteobacteria bacterium]|nr:ATP-binding cassette domain-containing protein [Gammaproteobacteria bacterium]